VKLASLTCRLLAGAPDAGLSLVLRPLRPPLHGSAGLSLVLRPLRRGHRRCCDVGRS